MPNGKGSNASPPAGHNRGQQSSQRGPTPPQPRPDDYSQRNNQGYPPQQMNVQGMPGIYHQGMVPNQGQPQRMYYNPRAMARPIRVPHHSQQSSQPMYPSPTSGQQIISIQGGGQGYPILQQPFVPSQVCIKDN
ncbi:cell death-inducing p53-target protein 1 homolog [Exaiptasia diaphana]|uniref:Uncharacterized protein n=1 Tax=Exaiptasia diaphana TaxID=2652724 RepID=A0A913YXU9_EXADI|nr:cell death-inducing p53-target protein 1 homolog [Exaiptasia diaphana]